MLVDAVFLGLLARVAVDLRLCSGWVDTVLKTRGREDEVVLRVAAISGAVRSNWTL